MMSSRYRYLHLDVFTGEKFGGNQLAVFLDARGLAAETMQAATRELNFSESTFILPAERPDTDIRMRIFTPGREMPMAGHPTVGSAFALAMAGVIPAGRRRWVFGLNVGPTPVDIEWNGDRPAFVWMTQLRPAFGPVVTDVEAAARAIGLDGAAIRAAGLPVQEVSCGVPFVFIPLATRAQVDAASPNVEAFDRLCEAAGVDNHAMFVFSREPGPDGATAYSRMFAPGLGVFEDPATGSASGPLGCYLVKHGVVPPERAGGMQSLQGVKMGRPSRVHIAIGLEDGEISRVQVGGEAVLVGEGELIL
ncbi:MAG: PhzF family phenazine biosynthesis protein [Rhodospirillaceae bacterium]